MKNLILVRGGGDLATGTIYKLKKCGFPVLILETANPSAIRRNVAFCEAVYQGTQTVEDMTCYRADSPEQARQFLREGKLTLLVDPAGATISQWKPLAVVDGILAKKNLGTNRNMAPITVALGPGFTAGEDVDAVIETKRGHHLGRVLWEGTAAPNTGIPGRIGGQGAGDSQSCGGDSAECKKDHRYRFQGRRDCRCGNGKGRGSCGSYFGRHPKGSDPGWISGQGWVQDGGYRSQNRRI